MGKVLQFNPEVSKSLLKGVKTLAKAVKTTLGPKGRNVIIFQPDGIPISTKDGVTVAKEIILKDKFENMGAQIFKEAALKTSKLVGDGTTTAIVLAEAIYLESVKHLSAGADLSSIKIGIEYAVTQICAALDRMAINITSTEKIKQVATISANNDIEIGSLIASSIEKVGKDGVISILEGKGTETTFSLMDGIQFDQGFISPYFVTHPKQMTVELDNVFILITDKKISNVKGLVHLLEKVMERGARSFLIIADDVEGEALKTLVINKVKAGFPLCAVKTPFLGEDRREFLQDLAVWTGATLILQETNTSLDNVELSMLGQCKRIKINKDSATLIGGAGDLNSISNRAEELKKEIARTHDEEKKVFLKHRLAKLKGETGALLLGAPTRTELKEKKSRFQDALNATQAAIQEGFVPGGGVALLRAASVLETVTLPGDQQIGIKIVHKACFSPLETLVNNCGARGSSIAEKIYGKQDDYGYDGLKGESINLIQEGIIDPTTIPKIALKNAASVANLLLSVGVVITEGSTFQKSSNVPTDFQ